MSGASFRIDTAPVARRLRLLSSLGGVPLQVAVALNELAEETMLDSKQHTPVRYGILRKSGHVSKTATASSLRAELAYGTDYACVLGGNTTVVCERGWVGIGQIKQGDRVLTQTGEYRPVIATQRMPARLKPDMVDIRAKWRSGCDHRLTVTSDHKVLAWRDGRRLWLPAGDLRPTDSLFHRAKQPHNKGHRAYVETCAWCGKQFATSLDRRNKKRRFF